MNMILRLIALVLALAAGAPLRAGSGPSVPITILRLPDGTRFGLIGPRPSRPAPTVFLLAHGLETMADEPHYTDAGRLLTPHGFLGVVLDPPAHGKDVRPGETGALDGGLKGWRQRLDNGEDFVAPFVAHCRGVLDYLVREKLADPDRVGAIGISRGGFLAIHLAAAEPRIRCVVGLSPVVDVMVLREFNGTPRTDLAAQLSLAAAIPRLVGRPLWISISNNDERVGADRVIAFSRARVAASIGGRAGNPIVPVELVVGPAVSAGGSGHYSVQEADALAANWILRQFGMPETAPLGDAPHR